MVEHARPWTKAHPLEADRASISDFGAAATCHFMSGATVRIEIDGALPCRFIDDDLDHRWEVVTTIVTFCSCGHGMTSTPWIFPDFSGWAEWCIAGSGYFHVEILEKTALLYPFKQTWEGSRNSQN